MACANRMKARSSTASKLTFWSTERCSSCAQLPGYDVDQGRGPTRRALSGKQRRRQPGLPRPPCGGWVERPEPDKHLVHAERQGEQR